MRALVTGGAGFIGSHLVDRLISLEYEVSVIDNLSSGYLDNVNRNADFHRKDILDEKFMESFFEKNRPDLIFHTAAQPYVSFSTQEPENDALINVVGSTLLMSLARRFEVKKFIYSNSGGASYGNPEYLPMDEEHSINPVSPYGVSKHTVEHYLKIFEANYGNKFTSLRYANVYGPRQSPNGEGGVISIFLDRLLDGRRPVIFGDGSQVRDYCFIDDVIDANIWSIDHGDNESYNVGTGEGTSTQEIFDLMKMETCSDLNPIYGDERVGDTRACVLDPKKLLSEGWRIRHSLHEGIRKTADYFRKEREKSRKNN